MLNHGSHTMDATLQQGQESRFSDTEKKPDLWFHTCPVTRVVAYKQIQAANSDSTSDISL